MTDRSALPPIGGYILTGQLRTFHAAHPPIILRHDLTANFFGIEEREAGWPDHHCFNVFPITPAALVSIGSQSLHAETHAGCATRTSSAGAPIDDHRANFRGECLRREKGETVRRELTAQGLAPAFGCRSGSCGTCRVRLIAGSVAYASRPGAARADDEVLICCATPAEGASEVRLAV